MGLGCQTERLVLKKGFAERQNGVGNKRPQEGGGEYLSFALARGKILVVRKDPSDHRDACRSKLEDP